jgi:hypothetical protein
MTSAIPVIAAAAFALAACDLSQKKVETIATMLPTAASAQTAGTATQAASAARSAAPAQTADEHSVRLYGRGVSRERQTRI